ncbi:MAG: clan AA aspartic protease [Verrucomicrobia bacterium]|nr:clan AA aspartic protease [Verrucomicrobiota bacterium]
MGRVDTKIKLQNWTDIELLALGMSKRAPRAVEVDALADTGAVKLYLKKSVIERLGLRPIGEVRSRTMSDRTEQRRLFSPVNLAIQGRSCQTSVIEVPDSLPNVVGQIPLEDLDLVVDCRRRRLIPNPEHKDGVMYDEF